MNRSIALVTEYDGTRFYGWQSQKGGRTVQQTLEQALTRLFSQPVRLTGCSRTDSGVHAAGHVSHFSACGSIPTERIPFALNAVLPEDLAVRLAVDVPAAFHARYDAKAKQYMYKVQNTRWRPALAHRFLYHEPRPLDVRAMRAAATHLLGSHDFTSFMAAGSSAKTTVRHIYDIQVDHDPGPHLITIRVTGDGFLYNMVRILAGTLVYVGLHRYTPDDVPGIISACDRRRAGKTLPARGLTLSAVYYDLHSRIETLEGDLLFPHSEQDHAAVAPKGEEDGT